MLSLFTLVFIKKVQVFLCIWGVRWAACGHVYEGQRSLSTLFSKTQTGFPIGLHLTNEATTAAQQTPEICFSLPPKYWDYNEHYNIHFPYQGPGIKLRSSWFQDKHLSVELLSRPLIKIFLTELRVSLRYLVLSFYPTGQAYLDDQGLSKFLRLSREWETKTIKPSFAVGKVWIHLGMRGTEQFRCSS